jgi:hypothetical protein
MDFDVLNTPNVSFSERDRFLLSSCDYRSEVTGGRGRTYPQGRRRTKRHRRTLTTSLGFLETSPPSLRCRRCHLRSRPQLWTDCVAVVCEWQSPSDMFSHEVLCNTTLTADKNWTPCGVKERSGWMLGICGLRSKEHSTFAKAVKVQVCSGEVRSSNLDRNIEYSEWDISLLPSVPLDTSRSNTLNISRRFLPHFSLFLFNTLHCSQMALCNLTDTAVGLATNKRYQSNVLRFTNINFYFFSIKDLDASQDACLSNSASIYSYTYGQEYLEIKK